jgi:heme-binding NEAT domain protein
MAIMEVVQEMRSAVLKKICVRWNEDLLENSINVLEDERKRRRLQRDDEVVSKNVKQRTRESV